MARRKNLRRSMSPETPGTSTPGIFEATPSKSTPGTTPGVEEDMKGKGRATRTRASNVSARNKRVLHDDSDEELADIDSLDNTRSRGESAAPSNSMHLSDCSV